MARASFASSLNYTSVNEDWRTEAQALRLHNGGRVLCVTGSGDRPLDLLATTSTRITAIDHNPSQNHLLRLKMAAMQALSFEDYARFLGLVEAAPGWREGVWAQLEPLLDTNARRYWRANAPTLARGILYQGRFERYARRLARIAHLLRPRTIDALFDFDDLEAQREFVRSTWDAPGWPSVFRLVLHPLTSRIFLGDPAYFAHPDVAAGRYLYRRMRRALMTGLARENFMLSLVLTGTLPARGLPPYLTADGYRRIRSRLDRIDVVDADLIDHAQGTPLSAFSHFSLSDVPSYLTRDQFQSLMNALARDAAAGARIVVRQFLTRYALSEPASAILQRDSALETELALRDRSFGYDFMVATVARPERPT